VLAPRIDSIQQKGHVDAIANNQGHCITPSWVSFTDDEHSIGDAAKNAYHSNPLQCQA
jgi:heat shock protein 5